VVHERLQLACRLVPYPGHEPGGDVHPRQIAHQLAGAGDRDMVGAGQVRGLGVHLRAVLHPAGMPGGGWPAVTAP
jgi:hypothetical protein